MQYKGSETTESTLKRYIFGTLVTQERIVEQEKMGGCLPSKPNPEDNGSASSSTNRFMLYARALSITWGDTPEYWTWVQQKEEARYASISKYILSFTKTKKNKIYIKSSVLKSRSLIQSPLLLLIKFSSEIGILHLPSYRFRYITLQLFLLGLVWRLHIFCSLILLLFSIFNFWRVMNNGYHLEC